MAFGPAIGPSGDASVQDDIDAFVARVREALERQQGEARSLVGDPA